MSRQTINNLTIFAFAFLMTGSILVLMVNSVYAQTSGKSGKLKFHVPEDWPIEERGGLVGPIPTEEYVAMKFDESEKEFSTIRSEIADKFDELRQSLKAIELKIEETKAVADSETDPSGPDGGQSGSLSKFEEFESQIARIDRKITNKEVELRSQTGQVELKLDALEKKIKNLQAQIYKLDEKIDYLLNLERQ